MGMQFAEEENVEVMMGIGSGGLSVNAFPNEPGIWEHSLLSNSHWKHHSVMLLTPL